MGSIGSKIGDTKGLVISIIGIITLLAITPITLGAIKDARSAATYANGDYSIEDSITGVQGVATTGIITCDDATAANNFALCGEGKWTAFTEVVELFPIMLAVAALIVATWFGIQKIRGQSSNPSLISGLIVGGAVSLLVSLVLITVGLDLLVTVIIAARGDGFQTSLGLWRLVPLIMLVGSFGLATLGTIGVGAMGTMGSRKKMRRGRRRRSASTSQLLTSSTTRSAGTRAPHLNLEKEPSRVSVPGRYRRYGGLPNHLKTTTI